MRLIFFPKSCCRFRCDDAGEDGEDECPKAAAVFNDCAIAVGFSRLRDGLRPFLIAEPDHIRG